jgi:hypothetical protein
VSRPDPYKGGHYISSSPACPTCSDPLWGSGPPTCTLCKTMTSTLVRREDKVCLFIDKAWWPSSSSPRMSLLIRPLMPGTSLSARLVTTALGPFPSISTVIGSTSVMPMGFHSLPRACSSSLFVLGEGDTVRQMGQMSLMGQMGLMGLMGLIGQLILLALHGCAQAPVTVYA